MNRRRFLSFLGIGAAASAATATIAAPSAAEIANEIDHEALAKAMWDTPISDVLKVSVDKNGKVTYE